MTVREAEDEPPAFETASEIVNVPAVPYVWAGGAASPEPVPSPKSHAQDVGVFVVVSVTVTLTGAVPDDGETVKDATGAAGGGGGGVASKESSSTGGFAPVRLW